MHTCLLRATVRLRKEIDTSDFQLLERGSGPSNIKNLTPITQVRVWKPRYYFFYGFLTNQSSIARSFGLADPPVVYRAFLRGHSVASLGQWKALLNGPADGVADGVAYKVENEWHESKLILGESKEYVPGSCIITILTGDGWFEIEGRTFKYYGSETGLRCVLPGASAFKDAVAARVG
jgi:hypothetical protein